jgi:hypothetical protein
MPLYQGKTGEMWELPERNTLSEIGSLRQQKKKKFSFSVFSLRRQLLIFTVYYAAHVSVISEHSGPGTICRNAQTQ